MIIIKSVYEDKGIVVVAITQLTPFEEGVLIVQFDVGLNKFDNQDLLNSEAFFLSYQDVQSLLDELNTSEMVFNKSIEHKHYCVVMYIDVEDPKDIFASIRFDRIRNDTFSTYESCHIYLNNNNYKDFFEGLQQLVEAHNETH